MSSDITLTASMRANLYSLQQTAQLMGTVQQRLATGKKVNSALDNPTNYFAAQTLTARANDISSLLDGMGQAIQSIKTATQGIESAESIVETMKAIANEALQAAGGSNASTTAKLVAVGATGTTPTAGAAITSATSTKALNDIADARGNQLFRDGDTLTVNGNTFTVTNTTAAVTTTGAGQGTTLADLTNWIKNQDTLNVTLDATGHLQLVDTDSSIATGAIGGNIAAALGITSGATIAGGATLSVTAALNDETTYASVPKADDTTKLTYLTKSDGSFLSDAATTPEAGQLRVGDTLTVQIGSGIVSTFTINATSTVADLNTWMKSLNAGLTGSVDGTGVFKVDNQTGQTITFGGKMAEITKQDPAASTLAAGASLTNTLYAGRGDLSIGRSTLLGDLNSLTGTNITTGNTMTVKLGDGPTTTITVGSGSGQVNTVGQLLDQLNSIGGLSATLDSSGKLQLTATNGENLDLGGTNLMSALGVSDASASATAPSAASIAKFDEQLSQLDKLVKDTSYQGINLISSSANAPLTVTFNEAATNANKLVINAVDLSSTGLGITVATNNWTNAGRISQSVSQLTDAANTLREQASNLGTNLTLVQTRQDFANGIISTLKEGSDKLTLADMNEEGANMLALQTRSQLGTQSLSLASQANQAVMRLFG